MSNNYHKIAVLINGLEPIFLNQRENRGLYVIVFQDSAMEIFAKKNFPIDRIIAIRTKNSQGNNFFYFHEMINRTSLTEQLKKFKISCVVLPYKSNKLLEDWSKKNKFKLIVTPAGLQKKLENKIFFDKLLKKNRINSPMSYSAGTADKKIKTDKIYVAQAADGDGLTGTNFFRGDDLLEKNRGKKRRPILIREYINGLPAGISIFLNKAGNFFFSGIRRQCFIYDRAGYPKNFLGIQWLPASFFSGKVKTEIIINLTKLTKALSRLKFIGVANVDFIIYREKIYVLECNPRLSAATPQVFSRPSLIKITNPWKFYLDSFLKKSFPGPKSTELPRPDFKGSTMDIDIKVESLIRIKRVLPIGIYRIKRNKIDFVSDKINNFQKMNDCFFLAHELSRPGIIKENFTLCSIISNFPLYNNSSGTMNQHGKIIYRYFMSALF